MKILQIFGAVVAVHLLAFIFIFASPGCQSGPHTMPTPDATMPTGSPQSPVTFNTTAPQPVDLGTPAATYTPAPSYGHAAPTRPGSAAAVAVTPAKATENVAPVSSYTVERGDSLWSIAKKNGLSVAELAKLNNLSTGTALKPGRKLIVPAKAGASKEAVATAPMSLPAEKTPVATRPTNGEALKHTVQVGESLGVIAKKFQVTVGELAAANNITDPSKVRAGQTLVIPGFKAVAGKGTPAVAKPAASSPAPAPTATATPPPAPDSSAPKFEIAPPPPGQDLDAGLKPADTEVPTIKVEEPAPETK
ncbi:MAG TPA: LysM peptidoglycan-binding domain-containing protein [Lacunisphaera sp.]